jgi:hypothetical protein
LFRSARFTLVIVQTSNTRARRRRQNLVTRCQSSRSRQPEISTRRKLPVGSIERPMLTVGS